MEHGHNFFNSDGVVTLAPAVVIRDHGHGGVADFGFAGQFGLLQVGHADHVRAPAAIEIRLGAGRKLRALHADVGAAQLADYAHSGAGADRGFGHGGANRIAKRDVADDAFAEKGRDAMKGAIDELVGHDKVRGLVLFLERADGGNGNNTLDAELLECVDVGAEVQLGGKNAMAASMAREKGDLASFEIAKHKSLRWLAEVRIHALFAYVGEAGHGVKTAAADNADFRLRQTSLLFRRPFSGPRVCLWQTSKYKGRGGHGFASSGMRSRRMKRGFRFAAQPVV